MILFKRQSQKDKTIVTENRPVAASGQGLGSVWLQSSTRGFGGMEFSFCDLSMVVGPQIYTCVQIHRPVHPQSSFYSMLI